MKNKLYKFAAFRPRTQNDVLAKAYFMPAAKVVSYCLLVGCLCLASSTVLGRTNEGNSLFYINIFHREMTKNVKNATVGKCSTGKRTQTERNTVSIEAFNIEMNAKNTAYYFILSYGLLDSFQKFCNAYRSDDPHWDCVNYLIFKI